MLKSYIHQKYYKKKDFTVINILEIINFKLTSEEVRLTSSIILIRLSIDVLSSAIYGRPLDITTNFKNRVLYTEINKRQNLSNF